MSKEIRARRNPTEQQTIRTQEHLRAPCDPNTLYRELLKGYIEKQRERENKERENKPKELDRLGRLVTEIINFYDRFQKSRDLRKFTHIDNYQLFRPKDSTFLIALRKEVKKAIVEAADDLLSSKYPNEKLRKMLLSTINDSID